jgi:membrane protease YdiL (CAAX protease family)
MGIDDIKYSKRRKLVWLVIGLSLGLLFMGALRLSTVHPNILTPLAGFATPGYVLITVLFTIFLVRKGLPLNKFGFGERPNFRIIILAISAVIILRLFDLLLNPLIEEILGGPRNLERFADVEGSVGSLIVLLITNWTLAAFGEEFAYRIVLMRGISFILGDTRKGQISAIILQAVMFGLIHAYQGPTGITGSTISGLIFGVVTIMSRWSIWPAALAHGINNTFGIIALYNGG